MRILITVGIFPPDIGGPATYVPQMATALAERGHQITVLTLSDQVDGHYDTYPFRVVRLPRRTFKLWRWLRTIATLIRLGRNADVLFVNGLAREAVLANVVLQKPMVQKVVGDLAWERATNRGWVEDSFEDFQKTRYGLKVEALKALRAWSIRKADKVIVPSRYLAQWVLTWGVPEENLTVIYNAMSPLSLTPSCIPMSTSVRVVTVGRLIPLKRIDQIIAAVAKCDGTGLIIIGDGPELEHLEGLARTLDLNGRIYFAGKKCREETLSLMAACDLCVLNSSHEGLPHVALEAIGLGLPVIATAVGGTPEVVQDEVNGLLIAPTANGALHDALLRLISSPSERRRLASGAKHIVERFRLSAMIEETENVLRTSLMLRGER